MEEQKIVIPEGIVLKKPFIGRKHPKKNVLRGIEGLVGVSDPQIDGEVQNCLKSGASQTEKIQAQDVKNEIITIDISKKINGDAMRKMVLPFPDVLKQKITREVVLSSAMTRAATNDNPNGAYTIAFDTLYSDVIEAQGDQRWYNFQVTEQKKLTVYMSPVADISVDNDLMLFKLDTTTHNLNLVSESKNYPGIYEQLSYIAEPGIYYICVSAYQCNVANQFTFFARQTGIWDVSEADDSMALAKEQKVGKILRRTLDNEYDEDCTILLVPVAGSYHFKLLDVPETCNYELQVWSVDQRLLATVKKNTEVTFSGFSAGGYFIKVLAPDGVVDASAMYTVLITSVPATGITNYDCILTPDRTHFIECLLYPEGALPKSDRAKTPSQWVIHIDGKIFDVSNLEIDTGRGNNNWQHKCGGFSTNESFIVEYRVGSYGSAKAPHVQGSLKNALILNLPYSIYSYSHYGPNGRYYDVVPNVFVWFIINLDNLEVADNMYPSFFYGTRDTFPSGVGQESASFSTPKPEYFSVSASRQPDPNKPFIQNHMYD